MPGSLGRYKAVKQDQFASENANGVLQVCGRQMCIRRMPVLRPNSPRSILNYAKSLKYTQVNYTVFSPFPVGRVLERLQISQTQMQIKEENLNVVQL